MNYSLLFLLSILLTLDLFGKIYTISGTIEDSKTSTKLSYANLRIENTTRGTTSNLEGRYTLKLEEGKYNLIASYIGYRSDTLQIDLNKNIELNFSLLPIELELNEVTVQPGRNLAYDIIEKCIATKNEILSKVSSYKYGSYTKTLIKTTKDFQQGSFSLSKEGEDTLMITGILENESRGFFKKPDQHKSYIVARKQTANTPPFVNILTGGNLIQSFYEDELLFIGKNLPSPISEEALTYYYYYIEKEFALDNQKIYQIYFNTDNTADPGFFGKIYIADSTFHLLKVDVSLNQMANFGGLFEFIRVIQQFSIFQDGIALPIDYRTFAEGNYLGLAKFGFELNTIMNNYEINVDIEDDFFDNAIISVIPGADNKKDIYWESIESIPNTKAEEIAYARIDSVTRVAKTFGQDFSFISDRTKLSKHIAITGPLSLYSFNKIEGSTLNLDLFYNDGEEQRLESNIGVSYGFADDLVKKELSGSYKFGNLRTTEFSMSLFDRVNDLFSKSNNYNKFTSTFLSLFTKFDFRDYYYRKGLDVNVYSEVFPILGLGFGFLLHKDESAINNSDFSIFRPDQKYASNEQIFNTKVQALKALFKLDFRKFIEDGFYRTRITPLNNILFEGSVLYSNKDLINTDVNFQMYELKTYGSFSTAGNWSLEFFGNKMLSKGTVPIQYLYALPGNINAGGKNNSFRTLRIGEVFGDDITTIFLRHNFQDDLFKLSQIPILKDSQIQFSTHLNIAIADVTEDSRTILDRGFKKFTKPFYELGFSIGHLLIPINFEFTWKLNYRGRNNFAFGINTIAF